ncbi:MAG: substrate-binding domain-containing protein [Alphaproteobacteria bacterium]
MLKQQLPVYGLVVFVAVLMLFSAPCWARNMVLLFDTDIPANTPYQMAQKFQSASRYVSETKRVSATQMKETIERDDMTDIIITANKKLIDEMVAAQKISADSVVPLFTDTIMLVAVVSGEMGLKKPSYDKPIWLDVNSPVRRWLGRTGKLGMVDPNASVVSAVALEGFKQLKLSPLLENSVATYKDWDDLNLYANSLRHAVTLTTLSATRNKTGFQGPILAYLPSHIAPLVYYGAVVKKFDNNAARMMLAFFQQKTFKDYLQVIQYGLPEENSTVIKKQELPAQNKK